MRAKEIINELFTQPYPYKWRGATEAYFSLSDRSTVEVNFYKFRDYRIYNIAFDRDEQHNLTGGGDQFRIFATVLKIVDDWFGRNHPPVVVFTADISEPSRVKLYQRLTNSLAKNYGYIIITENPNVLNDQELSKTVSEIVAEYHSDRKIFFLADPGLIQK